MRPTPEWLAKRPGERWVHYEDVRVGDIVLGWAEERQQGLIEPNFGRYLITGVGEKMRATRLHSSGTCTLGSSYWFNLEGPATPEVNPRYPHVCPVCTEVRAYVGATPAAMECLNGCSYGRPFGKAP